MNRYRGPWPDHDRAVEVKEAMILQFTSSRNLHQLTELCGLMVLSNELTDEPIYEFLQGGFIDVPNEHSEPYDNFHITRKWFQRIQAIPEIVTIIGVGHTHLDGHRIGPSQNDIQSIPEDLLGAVYHVPSRTVTWYNCDGIIRRKRK